MIREYGNRAGHESADLGYDPASVPYLQRQYLPARTGKRDLAPNPQRIRSVPNTGHKAVATGSARERLAQSCKQLRFIKFADARVDEQG
jgi:hypothetical protein